MVYTTFSFWYFALQHMPDSVTIKLSVRHDGSLGAPLYGKGGRGLMRVVYMGTPDFAVNTLQALIDSEHEVVGVVTQPDKPKGRGKTMQFTPVKELALAHGISVYQPAKVREEAFIEELRALNPDIIIVAAFGQILPEVILNMPKYGCINVHASLLPKYRGAAPIQWCILDGEKETGVTIMYMEKGLDTGDMIAKVTVPIDEQDTGDSLHDKLAKAGAELLIETLPALEAGTAVREKQDDALSSYAKMLTKDMGHIDFTKTAKELSRLIRGMYSWPGAFTHFHGKTLKIHEADVVACENTGATPGQVVAVDKKSFTVACGEDGLRIRNLQLEGKKRMDTAAFLLGNTVQAGDMLGAME